MKNSNKSEQSIFLLANIYKYFVFLLTEKVPGHPTRDKNSMHSIDNQKRCLGNFCQVLRANDIDPETYRIYEVDDEMVGKVHAFLIEQKKYAASSYNSNMRCFLAFFNWLKDEEGHQIGNPFKAVLRRKSYRPNSTITPAEIDSLFEIITHENG